MSPGWAGGGGWWCWSDDAEEEDEILKNWNRDFLYGNWYFLNQILKFRCLVVYYWTFNLGEGPFALALTTYAYILDISVFFFFILDLVPWHGTWYPGY